jgi:thiamine-monophosphate kinase
MCNDVVLTGVALGTAPPEAIVSRSGAKDGDIVAVTGDFGLTSVAFEILIRGLKADSDLHRDALEAAYRPEIHIDFVPALAKAGAVTASMDSSDGLGITLHSIAKQSGCGVIIDELPINPEVEAFCKDNKLDTMKTIMQGGEEFLLVLAIPSKEYDIAQDVAKKKKVQLRKIGSVTTGEQIMWKTEEGLQNIPSAGYDNFKEWS